jgi:WD40 repeat protein
LAFAGDLHGAVTAWRVAGSDGRLDTRPGGQQRAAVYRCHNAPVREIVFPAAEFNVGIGANAAVFASAAADSESPLVLWDTETGQPLQRLALDPSVFVGASGVRARAAGCTALTFIPAGTHAASGRGDTLLLAGMGRHLVLFDARSGRRVMDLDGHNERVQHVAVVQGGRAVMSCAQDRTVRLWDVRSPVSLQEFADASMEAVAHVAEHPSLDDVCLQSNDNRVRVLLPAQARAGRGAAGSMPSTAFQYRMAKETAFGGHSVSGTGCRLDFSRTDNGRVLSSGDIHGTLTLWDYGQGVRATRGGGDEHAEVRKPLKAMRVHAEALTAHLWHPLFPSTILTASQDGTLKLFT